jgi:hypothetical protein
MLKHSFLFLLTLSCLGSQNSQESERREDRKIQCTFCRKDITGEDFYIVPHPKGKRYALFLCNECNRRNETYGNKPRQQSK